jgi:1-acyl-sn-glycerol-3-phosphate acyltransferase
VWPKKGAKKPNKKIIISILPSIDYAMEKNEFVNDLEKKIYTELNRIN